MTKKIIDVERKYEALRSELSGSVDEIIEMLQRRKLETPVGSTLILSYETVYDYGDEYSVVKLYDRRLETDEEYKIRLAQEAEAHENRMISKRAQFLALKKELGEE